MSAFTMALAMNPNINNEQFAELCKKDAESSVRLIETFSECLGKLETKEQKMQYFNTCFPVLMTFIF